MGTVDNVIRDLQNYKKQLQSFKETADNTKLQRVSNESKLEMLRKTEADVIAKIKDLGYDPDNLKTHISEKMADLKAITTKLDSVMPDKNGVIPSNAAQILGIVKPSNPVEEVTEETIDTSMLPMGDDDDMFGDIDLSDMPL